MPAQKNRNRPPSAGQSGDQGIGTARRPVHSLGGTELAQYLGDPQRSQTVVVVSYIPGDGPRLDAVRLARQLDNEADVYELCNGTETRRLQRGLPENLHVFGNGVRVYPYGPQWPARCSLPFLFQRQSQLPKIYERIELAVLASRLPAPPPATAPVPALMEAVVMGFPFPDRAMVELHPGGARAMIRGEDLLPGIPLDWLLGKGQRLTGVFDPETRFLDIKAALLPRPSPVRVYKHGDVALARVTSVCPRHAFVQLWPGSVFQIGAAGISSNDLDSVQDLLTEDEVVRVRVLYDNGAVRLSMLDVDDEEPVAPAPPLLRGGPPWLDLARPYASIPSPGAVVSSPDPGGPDGEGEDGPSAVVPGDAQPHLSPAERRTALQSTQRELERARHVIDELMADAKRHGATEQIARAMRDQLGKDRAAAADLARMLNAAEHQIEALRDDLSKTKASLVQLRQQRRSVSSRSENAAGALFLDAGEQFRFDLRQAWAHAVPAVEKAAHPLGDFRSSQLFLDSWAALTEQQRAKTLRAVVDLVAGRQGPLRRREPHSLRLHEGAQAGPTLRGEDVCMRLYVEQKTPGALRLHYWKSPSGGLELHQVVTHDVVKP